MATDSLHASATITDDFVVNVKTICKDDEISLDANDLLQGETILLLSGVTGADVRTLDAPLIIHTDPSLDECPSTNKFEYRYSASDPWTDLVSSGQFSSSISFVSGKW